MKLVLASNNAKKLAELRTLLEDTGVELVAQGELGIAETEEPHFTFIENALDKARHAAAAAGGAAIADDSGLCVEALDGEPGVVSAHFAAIEPMTGDREAYRHKQDRANNELLLRRLQDEVDRRAHFVSTLVAVRHARDPQPLVAVGRWTGQVLLAPRGEQGFGYDPLLFIPALGRTVAELDPVTKNAHSHRALAMAQMKVLMREVWQL